ncbi:hypothetical protein C8F04DRAFT_1105987 [Mycena alexandri]|uniref:BHLH domain-containing protein n=1 Tax=Mycena alexandri TaxID=1745969 RepID=A0AAD6S3F7_9AGAR|nr:hypothetical protein C8F04DRAFT_1147252 [Mycena alexandri]KAJ7032852.1 hypothetical protein C8F04DRAFT_1105987 [Mycena alexandri]
MTVYQPAESVTPATVPTHPTQILIPALPEENSSTAPTSSLDSASGAQRVKPRQRNSAARRASHNAVERQRREHLNSRFLDLASLLPNLANIRRPSKSSIVNTCIAHVHASRRHRFLASQQLRVLKEECDSLRREVNEWRERAGGIMLLPPPNRGEVFAIILDGTEFELDDELHSGEGDEEEYGEEDGGNVARYTHQDLERLETHYSAEDLARLELFHHHQRQQLEQAHAHAHAHAHAYQGGHFQSPFAHDLSPRSAHSAGLPDVSWHDDGPAPPPHSARSARSANEPVMTHPYMHIVPSHTPLHDSHEQGGPPLYDHLVHPPHHGQQTFFHHDTPKWEFIDETQPNRRPYRHGNW